ncbi:multi-sensor hybrid histidine kinase [Desulfatibacillum aliphaticivorans]|uniref:histidine kinase n=1 Tax=Desulfatibacillum aliphaticivorans TaxID=218208 RepID=B8FFF1_DESAL|nr:multi-sensor hybrid histidine kinase [Desulfatibacillum aliphaticivorans]
MTIMTSDRIHSYRYCPFPHALTIICLTIILLGGNYALAKENTFGNKQVLSSAAEIDYPPFSAIDKNGQAIGFSVELMRAALKSMGREVTFRTGPWPQVKGWLEQGEVQALPLVGRTPEREAAFDFTFPYMSIHGAIVVRKGEAGIRDLKDLKGREVAVMKSDNAEEFLRREDCGAIIHTTDTFEQALSELSQGRHDAVVIQRLVALRLIQEARLTNLKIVNKPVEGFRQDFCFAVKEGDRDTLALLNEGLSLVMADGTYRHLHAKWFAALQLPTNRRIIIGGDYNYPPYEFLNENNLPEGMNVDLTRAIAREMGLNIDIRLGPWSKAVEDLENGAIDALEGMFYSPERDLKFDFTPPHTLNHYVSITRKGEGPPPLSMEELTGKSIVVQKGDMIYNYAVKHGLKDNISLKDTQEDVLRGVSNGMYDCALSARVTTLYLINKNNWTNLELGRQPILTTEYCYAVPNGHKALLAQFSEGLKIIEETGEYRRIRNKWLGVYEESHTNLAAIIRYVAMVAIPLLLLLLAFFLWSWSLRKQVAARTAELQKSEEQYRLLADNTLDVIWTLNPKLEFTYINPAILELTGYTAEKWINTPLSDHCDAANLEYIKQVFAEEAAKGTEGPGVIFEAEWLKKNGEPVQVEIHGKVLHDENGQVSKFQGTARDITMRKQAENELRQRESQYNAIVENSGDYIMRYDRSHRHIFANREAIEATGLTPEQYLGKTHREMGFPKHLCELWENSIDEVFLTGEVRCVDFDVELENGWVSLEMQLNPEFNEEGSVQSVIGISRDITKRKAAQQEDRLNKGRLEIIHVIQNLTDISEKKICDIILEKMVDLLDSKIGFLGFMSKDEKIMHIHAWSSSAMEQCTIQHKPITFSIAESGVWGEPVRNRKAIIINDYNKPHPAKKGCPAGHVAISRFLSVPVFDSGRIVMLAAVANKVNPYTESDLRQFELLLNSAWEQIQRRRMEKERESLIAQLQRAQKMESIGNLAGGIAHDFNNLLSPIVGMSELLLEDLPPDSLEYENAQEIFTAGKRASDLVNQILAFSRQSEHKKIPVLVQKILREVLKLSRSTIPADIQISQDIMPDCGPVIADPTQIHQLVMNFITNAYHAVEKTGGEIFVQLKETKLSAEEIGSKPLGPGRYAVLVISDNGEGINPAILDKIFEPYFTTKELGKGTGLGLAVAYGIIKEHKGDISVESELGSGTAFTIHLPIMEKSVSEGPAPLTESDPRGHERILLVDDEEAVAKLEKQMIERLGYHVTACTSSTEALRVFEANPHAFDLVLSDMTMPGMTGDLLSIKMRSIRPDMPVIICTGFSEKINEENAKAAGIKGLLMKPIIKSEMAKLIRTVLDEAKTSN